MIDTDAELEQALTAAFAREAAPATLIPAIEARLREAAARPRFVPTFATLTIATRSRFTSLLSLGAHAVAASLIFPFALAHWHARDSRTKTLETALARTPFIPAASLPGATGGGGGGGDHSLIETSKGRLPQIAKTQLAPPQLLRLDNPKLPVTPTVLMPQSIQLPNAAQMPNLGLPQSPQVALASQGSGSDSGFGTGTGGGIGSGRGEGLGPGTGGGYGGGVMRVGGGVSAPILIYGPDPEFSDEARRAKYEGVCVVSLIVDPQGNPHAIHIARSLGMGLDEKAIDAVRHYKFKPALYKGQPVAVAADVEVNFHIY